MSVKIGHASISETGKITGNAGDQTGKEVCIRTWYKHSKGWRVFRCKDAITAEKIARCMEMACANNKIGYDQNQRNTLYNAAKPYDFDVSKVATAVETDCSALVRVCCAYAGIMLDNFNTSTEPTRLLNSGMFIELTGSKYTTQDAYLRRGDILCTKTQGHTVIVLENGKKSGESTVTSEIIALGDRLLKLTSPIMTGDDVRTLQSRLNALGFDCGEADGEFGKNTEKGVKAFQEAAKIEIDGKFGSETFKALEAYKTTSEEYTVKGGDSLWKIAKALLGDGARYPEIVKLNGLKTTTLRAGQKLKIPTK